MTFHYPTQHYDHHRRQLTLTGVGGSSVSEALAGDSPPPRASKNRGGSGKVPVKAPKQGTDHRPVGGPGAHDTPAGGVDDATYPRTWGPPLELCPGPGPPMRPVGAPSADRDIRVCAQVDQARLLEQVAAAPAVRRNRLLMTRCRCHSHTLASGALPDQPHPPAMRSRSSRRAWTS